MALFGNNIYEGKIKCPFSFSSTSEKKEKEPTLKELAEEKFGEDRNLIMHLETFLHEQSKKKQLPTRLAWSMQLKLLEKFPKEERAKQVVSSIMKGYRAIAYEGNLNKYKKEIGDVGLDKEKEENIVKIAY